MGDGELYWGECYTAAACTTGTNYVYLVPNDLIASMFRLLYMLKGQDMETQLSLEHFSMILVNHGKM